MTTLNRDSRMRVFVAGGFTGGLMGTPVDITLDKLPDDAFEETKKIFGMLTATDKSQLVCSNKGAGDFGHYVFVGAKGDAGESLTAIFRGKFRPTPDVVIQLQQILNAHAGPEDLQLKP